MATLNSFLTTGFRLLADSSFSSQLYSTIDLMQSPPHVRSLQSDMTLQKMQKTLLTSGVQVVLTNTVDMTRFKLAWLNCATRCTELNVRAAQMTRQAIGREHQQFVIAGNIGAANVRVSHAEMVNAYAEQAEALAMGGVDCLWLEGFQSADELEAALTGCAIGSADLPIIATIALMEHTKFSAMIELLDQTTQVVALGVDATYGLTEFGQVLTTIETNKPVAIKGNLNALTTEFGSNHCVVELWQQFAQHASQHGATIIAGDELCDKTDLVVMSNVLAPTLLHPVAL